ncbi:MAG: glycosyltransferase [Candidatus Omnitrophota bacterium]|nr:MAG: glycosyltransferase [Candidatus Omnitrophota bacterium]
MNQKKKPLEMHRILIVAPLKYGTTSFSRLKALKNIFKAVEAIDITPYINNLSLWKQLLTNHMYVGGNLSCINREVIKRCAKFGPDMLWVDKGLYVWPQTLKDVRRRGSLLIHFSPDNHMIPSNQNSHYRNSIPLYDIHITTKMHNVEWLLEHGAPAAKYIGNGFDPDIHRPITLTEKECEVFGCDVGFVGHWEPAREEALLWLYKKGYRMKVWGGNWEHARHRKHPLFIGARHLVGDEYTKAICGAKINLCFLSLWHKDKTTDRSVEIPACGQFMLAERNEEHLKFFEDGIEAEFYENDDEMIEKINYYLEHEDERKAIGQFGRKRCLAGYSNEARLRSVLQEIIQE